MFISVKNYPPFQSRSIPLVIKKYIDDFERHQSGSTQPETALSTYLSSPPLFRIGTRSKVHLTQEVQSFIDAQLEASGKKVQQGMRKQILKNIDILQLLHEQGFGIGYTTVCNLSLIHISEPTRLGMISYAVFCLKKKKKKK